MKQIYEDDRLIKVIYYNNFEDCHRVGEMGCTKIEAYGENGYNSPISFLAVWYGDKILYRLPATMVQINYYD